MFKLAGKNVIVIGGSRGVGRQIVESAHGNGARVLAVARQEAALRTLQRNVPDVRVLALDATDEATPAKTFDASTDGDRPRDWLCAGQGMERVLLLATLEGLATSFSTQALEWPDLRWPLRDPSSGTGHVQMMLRLGYGPKGPKVPRRPVEDVLVTED